MGGDAQIKLNNVASKMTSYSFNLFCEYFAEFLNVFNLIFFQLGWFVT